MKKLMAVVVPAVFAAVLFVSTAEARNSMLSGVNSTCGTSYGCGACHIDPQGGGPLTAAGAGYAAAGNDSCYFCPDVCGPVPTCTDADSDSYFAETNCGTSVDCNDNNAAVSPGAIEACSDSIDNDCDGKLDCVDGDCTTQCSPTSPEVCNDAIDNDGDLKVDCADRDCRNDPACAVVGTEGKGKTCTDGKDNDADGLIDCADPGCAAAVVCK
jgi:putative metal-binding protein